MAVKYHDTYTKKWSVAFIGSLAIVYLIFVLPFHIPLAAYAIYNFQELIHSQFIQDRLLTLLIIPSMFLSLIIVTYSIYRQRTNICHFKTFFAESGVNVPFESDIAKAGTGLYYLALDTKNGTLLYINHPDTTILNFFFPKDVRVMGFGMYDWESVEVGDDQLTIYTGKPELPSISVKTRKANQIFEKIQAMRSQTWNYENSIPGYVEYQAKRIADAKGLNLILPPHCSLLISKPHR